MDNKEGWIEQASSDGSANSARNELGGTVHGAAVQASYIGSIVFQVPDIAPLERDEGGVSSAGEDELPAETEDDEGGELNQLLDPHSAQVLRANGFSPESFGLMVNDEDPEDKPAIDLDELIWWVNTTLLPLVERSPTTGANWCPRWWLHAEAIFRFRLIQMAWEHAVVSTDPRDLSEWMLHVADPHMQILLSAEGPFGQCNLLRHSQNFLPYDLPQELNLEPWQVEVLNSKAREVWADSEL